MDQLYSEQLADLYSEELADWKNGVNKLLHKAARMELNTLILVESLAQSTEISTQPDPEDKIGYCCAGVFPPPSLEAVIRVFAAKGFDASKYRLDVAPLTRCISVSWK